MQFTIEKVGSVTHGQKRVLLLLRPLGEGFNRVNSQPPNGLKLRVILTIKTFRGISSLTISADLHGLLAPEESLHLKIHWPCYIKKNVSEHYKTLQFSCIF